MTSMAEQEPRMDSIGPFRYFRSKDVLWRLSLPHDGTAGVDVWLDERWDSIGNVNASGKTLERTEVEACALVDHVISRRVAIENYARESEELTHLGPT